MGSPLSSALEFLLIFMNNFFLNMYINHTLISDVLTTLIFKSEFESDDLFLKLNALH